MKKNIAIVLLFLPVLIINIYPQNSTKLVVGIVVDQMRYDYLEKYYKDFGDNGFRRIIEKGTNFSNCKINYIPTVTAAGHASIYTGTTPYFNGIIANDWKDRDTEKNINSCDAISPDQNTSVNGIANNKSPQRLQSSTIGDQLKLHSYGKSKVYSISLKDRGALLPAGKSADGAFWFNESNGKFISSFYYYDSLPSWMEKFNNSGKVKSYLSEEWNLLKSIDVYQKLPSDESPYEEDLFNEGNTSFPHSLKNVPKEKLYEKLVHSPFGNQILIDLAKEILKNENLGKNYFTDHLAISFSTPDKIGHAYGPQSYEVKDCYLRLDQQLAELFNTLDTEIGNDNYILFLTADHGAMENTRHLQDLNFDAGVLENTNFYNKLQKFLYGKYKSNNLIKTRFSRNLYLNYREIDSLGLDYEIVEQAIKNYLLFNVPEIEDVYTRSELELMRSSRENNNYILNGFNKKRSGDILYALKANYLNWEHKFGSQHGSGQEYDNHIPLIFYGANIQSETNNEPVYIVDIAATITHLIGVNKPSACIGIPLIERK